MDAELWAEIRRLCLREGYSRRKAARTLHIDPKTVARALAMEPYQPRKKQPPRPSKLDAYKERIKAMVERYPDLSRTRILEELRHLGYEGGSSILGDFLRVLRPPKAKRAFRKIDFPPGDAAQVDWAHCGTIEVEGERRRLSAFLFLVCWSRYLYVEFTVSEKLEVFLACHERALAAVGGVTKRVLYDNLRSVVLAHVGREVRFHPRFLDYARHQGFKPVACAPYQPQEKGRVENAVRFLRTGFLAGREKHDLGHLNEQVTRWLAEVANQRLHRTTGRKPAVMLAEEMPLLWPLPGKAYDTRLVVSLKVGSTCRVRFETNTYSVPPENVGMLLTLKASDDHVTLFAAGEQVASHQRCKGRHQDVVDPQHVRSLHRRKQRGERGALVQRFLALCPTAASYLKGLTHAEIALYKHLRRILSLADHYGREDVIDAIEHALSHKAFGADYIERIVLQERRRRRERPITPLTSLEHAPDAFLLSLPEIDLAAYDRLLGVDPDEERPSDELESEQASGSQPEADRPQHDPGPLQGGPEESQQPEAGNALGP